MCFRWLWIQISPKKAEFKKYVDRINCISWLPAMLIIGCGAQDDGTVAVSGRAELICPARLLGGRQRC